MLRVSNILGFPIHHGCQAAHPQWPSHHHGISIFWISTLYVAIFVVLAPGRSNGHGANSLQYLSREVSLLSAWHPPSPRPDSKDRKVIYRRNCFCHYSWEDKCRELRRIVSKISAQAKAAHTKEVSHYQVSPTCASGTRHLKKTTGT